jgi:hypothetical protein
MRSGGFAPAHALVIDLEDTYCLFCSRDARRGWIHIASQHLVCTECMRDPDADEGAVGMRTSERVMAVESRPAIW